MSPPGKDGTSSPTQSSAALLEPAPLRRRSSQVRFSDEPNEIVPPLVQSSSGQLAPPALRRSGAGAAASGGSGSLAISAKATQQSGTTAAAAATVPAAATKNIIMRNAAVGRLAPAETETAYATISISGFPRPGFVVSTEGSCAHCVNFDATGNYLAIGLSCGNVIVYHLETNERIFKRRHEPAELRVAVTSLSWRPKLLPQQSPPIPQTLPAAGGAAVLPVAHETLAVAYPDGMLLIYHPPTGRTLSTCNEGENQLFAIEYSPTGKLLASAGSDSVLRIYDANEMTLLESLRHGHRAVDPVDNTGHTSRIYALRWHPRDPNIIITGGWDSTIQVWDRALGYSIRSLFHPYICGETLDIDKVTLSLLAGSHSPSGCLSIYENIFNSMPASTTATNATTAAATLPKGASSPEHVLWSAIDNKRTSKLYSAYFSPKNRLLVAAGGVGGKYDTNEMRIFHRNSRRCVAMISGFRGGVFCSGMSGDERFVAIGGDFQNVFVIITDTSGNTNIAAVGTTSNTNSTIATTFSSSSATAGSSGTSNSTNSSSNNSGSSAGSGIAPGGTAGPIPIQEIIY